ncbi:cell envelope integrity protein TolA [Thiobacillus sp.]|uniref:cell envelope integrity protein TolA n=1 Tax=Thiobacillus sp. TaxID=924 RepID=UPI0011D45A43|nr:cell envelope integrity protein TolA [Thiobacillus sp.]TXH75366.1 MAG: cell envelope integrity protein TolA [Thiobacillus sp.]
MNFTADAPPGSRPVPNLLAAALALGVHVLFVLMLVFGVSWQTHHPEAVMVDLWETLPDTPPPPAKSRPPPPVKAPKPEPVAPAPKPVEKEPPPKTPDIALEKKKAEAERLKKLQAMQAAEEKTRAEAAKALREKQQAEQKRQALLRQMEEEDLKQRVAAEAAANEARLARLTEAQAAANKRQAEVASVVGQYRDQISAKVRGNTRLPDNLKGNPEVRCLVKLLPTGEVQSVRVTKSSGNPAYDDAVVRAIEKSSPLPLPSDRAARAAFVPELSFVHRPKE